MQWVLPIEGGGMLQADGTFLLYPGGGIRVSSTAYENGRVLKTTKGVLVSLIGHSSLGSSQFIQLHDATSAPADSAVPVASIIAPANSNFYIEIPIIGMPFSNGIYVCNSTTGATKTIGAANCFFTAFVAG